MNSNNIYSLSTVYNLPVIDSASTTCNLTIPNQTFKVKSISLDWNLFDSVSGELIPESSNGLVRLYLQCGYVANSPQITKIFNNIANINVAAQENGNLIRLFKKGQTFYNNFFVANVLPMALMLTNESRIDTFLCWTHLSIEVELIKPIAN